MRALLTGANRGIGLEFARQMLQAGDTVVATCRDPAGAPELQALAAGADGRGTVMALDVGDPRSVGAAAEQVRGHLDALDLLVNNAGMGHDPGFDEAASTGPLERLDAEAVLGVLRTNVVGPALVTQSVAGLLQTAPRGVVLNISSGLGSISRAASPGNYAYAMSKAALNMLTRKLAVELRDQGTIAVTVSPGWVRTDMGGPNAPLSVEQSVADLLALVDRLSMAESGTFLDQLGQELPW